MLHFALLLFLVTKTKQAACLSCRPSNRAKHWRQHGIISRGVRRCARYRARQVHTWLIWRTRRSVTSHRPQICLSPLHRTLHRQVSSCSAAARSSILRCGSLTHFTDSRCQVSSGPTAGIYGTWCSRKRRSWRIDETRTCLSGMPDWTHACGPFSWTG